MRIVFISADPSADVPLFIFLSPVLERDRWLRVSPGDVMRLSISKCDSVTMAVIDGDLGDCGDSDEVGEKPISF